MRKVTILILTITLLLLASCAQQTVQPTPAPVEKISKGVSAGGDEATVRIKGMSFVPNNLNIKTGTKVTWRNEDPVPHNVVSSDGTLQSPTLHKEDTWSFTFETAGTYDYICSIHPDMKGSVKVE